MGKVYEVIELVAAAVLFVQHQKTLNVLKHVT